MGGIAMGPTDAAAGPVGDIAPPATGTEVDSGADADAPAATDAGSRQVDADAGPPASVEEPETSGAENFDQIRLLTVVLPMLALLVLIA